MAKCVLIIGTSGSGKSSSARNFNKDELAFVNVMGKDLPFPGKFDSTLKSTDYETIMRALLGTEKKSILIDDAGYLITNYFMKNHVSAADKFAIYNEMADRHWGLIRFITEKLPEDTIVYIVQHEDVDELGRVKPKTIGKLLDDKVCLEGLFAIVLRAEVKDGKYQFLTHGEGIKGAKTPIGMFEEDYIDNDLKMVDKRIREYYGIKDNDNKGE